MVLCHCRYVIHCAGIVNLKAKGQQGYASVVEPTVKGVENVLRSVNRMHSVERGNTGCWQL